MTPSRTEGMILAADVDDGYYSSLARAACLKSYAFNGKQRWCCLLMILHLQSFAFQTEQGDEWPLPGLAKPLNKAGARDLQAWRVA